MATSKSTYFLEWCKRSTEGVFGWMQFALLLLAAVGTVVGHLKPDIAVPNRVLLWLMPTFALVVVVIYCGARGGYELYRELECQYEKSVQELVQTRQQLEEQRASRMRSVAGLISLCREIRSADDARFVLAQVSQFLRHNCSELDVVEFERIVGRMTEDQFDRTKNAAGTRREIVAKAVEYLKQIRHRSERLGGDETSNSIS